MLCRPATAGDTSSVIHLPLRGELLSLYHFGALRFDQVKSEAPPKGLLDEEFYPLDEVFPTDSLFFADSVHSIWFRFTVRNIDSVPAVIALVFPIGVNKAILYERLGHNLVLAGKTGFALAVIARTISYDDNRVDIRINAYTEKEFYIHVPRLGFRFMIIKSPVLQNATVADLEVFHFQKDVIRPGLLWSHFFTGVFFMFFVFGLIKFLVLGREKVYLYYALLGISNALLSLVQAEYPPVEFPILENLRGIELFNLVNGVCIFLQGLFILEILQLKHLYPKVSVAIKFFLFFQLSIVVLQTAAWTFKNELMFIFEAIYPYHQALFLLVLLSWVIYLYTIRRGFYRFIFFGAVTVFIAFTLYFLIQFFNLYYLLPAWAGGDKRGSVNHFMQFALFVDLMFYFTALAHRDREVKNDKLLFQQQLIDQLQKNETMQQQFTAELEQQVKDKTEELLVQREALEAEKEAKLLADFNRKFSESELKALRSQMNPHFVFNILNTIESYALQNNKEAASLMIQKFSKLTRLVLENSMNQLVPFENDWTALKLYTELEQMRYANKFQVHFNADPQIFENGLLIPPMIIQPFVENAIIHGLRNMPGDGGVLTISATLENEHIILQVEDNGVGRSKARSLQKNNLLSKMSLGIKVTQDRISIYNKLEPGKKAEVTFEDLVRGTRVTICLPVT